MKKKICFLFQYISNKMQRYTVYLYLETALHVSGRTSGWRLNVETKMKRTMHSSRKDAETTPCIVLIIPLQAFMYHKF
jgi:hypothetical protein